VVVEASAHLYRLEWLREEVATSINTTASGGDASVLTIGRSSAFPDDVLR